MLAKGELTEGYMAIATAERYAAERGIGGLPLLDAIHAVVWKGADVGATLRFVVRAKEQNDPTWSTSLLQGLQESLSPMLLGTSFVTLTALAIAVARRREAARVG